MTNDNFSQDAEDTVREMLERATRDFARLQDDIKRLRSFARARGDAGRISSGLVAEIEAFAGALLGVAVIVVNDEYKGHRVTVHRYVSAVDGAVLYRYSVDDRSGVSYSDRLKATSAGKRKVDAMVERNGERTAKTGSREALIADLRELLGEDFFIRESENFDGREGAIWTTNEQPSAALAGGFAYDDDACQPHSVIEALLKKHDWFCEPYDAGTLFLYNNREVK